VTWLMNSERPSISCSKRPLRGRRNQPSNRRLPACS